MKEYTLQIQADSLEDLTNALPSITKQIQEGYKQGYSEVTWNLVEEDK